MDHLDLTLWIDFARGLRSLEGTSSDSAESVQKIRDHLQICSKCTEEVRILERALEVSQRERAFLPPADLVRAAESIFPVPPLRKSQPWSGLRLIAAELLENSLTGAVPAGVRTLRSDGQHLSYRAGRYSVDLRLENDTSKRAITLTGQIADNEAPDTPLQGAQALVLAEDHLVACDCANDFGEFSLHYRQARRLRLFLPLETRGDCIELSLDQRKAEK